MWFGKTLLILGVACVMWKSVFGCNAGFAVNGSDCIDMNECDNASALCGNHSRCLNTNGSFFCECLPGYRNRNGKSSFTTDGQCRDINECTDNTKICGPFAKCKNMMGSYNCTCKFGYVKINSSNAGPCEDIDECTKAKNEAICGKEGSCRNTNGSYWCECSEGYTNYGNERTPCSELNCERFSADSRHAQSLLDLADILSMMKNSCLALSGSSTSGEGKSEGDALLEKLLTAADSILSPGPLDSSEGVSGLLSTVENSILLIGPQLKHNITKIETAETDAQIAIQRGRTPPTGPIYLTNENAALSTDWKTAAGTGTYPGFALAALLSYKNLEGSVNRSFEELKEDENDDMSFQIFSKVVSVVVSNPSTQNLSHNVTITLRHLQEIKESPELSYICAYWKEKGAWSTDGCHQQQSNATHTVCTCKHLSSFAVLMALYPMEPDFGLLVVTKIGLVISLLCLILSILTFKFCRSIQGTRNTIHLHLCICLFVADLIFLVGISQTTPEGGCKFVAAMLHLFFLGVFTWMLLEGVQLYRMVVLVFNATIRPLYLYVTGYGTPLVIVIISAIIRPNGYGTDRHCWLSSDLIWSFFGPVCFIIILNVFFFIITVWKLAQKFTSLNPDLSKLHKIKAFTVTAIAQMCVLGLMWVFGAFLFQKGLTPVEYIFTILNSLQGALVFIMHCLLSKQVREEYINILCTPQMKKRSDFSSTNPSSSQSQLQRAMLVINEETLE